jgi:AcrR family transcriptional regulator
MKILKQRRNSSEERRNEILLAAYALAEEMGAQEITREAVAKKASVSYGLVHHYFGHMSALKDLVIEKALNEANDKILFKSMSIEALKKEKANKIIIDKIYNYLTSV